MQTNLIEGRVQRTENSTAAAPPPARSAKPGLLPVTPSRDVRPLDWPQAVDAAAARLEESWVHPDTTGHMLASGLASELAATLCAYGMMAAEVDHMRDHANKLTAGRAAIPG